MTAIPTENTPSGRLHEVVSVGADFNNDPRDRPTFSVRMLNENVVTDVKREKRMSLTVEMLSSGVTGTLGTPLEKNSIAAPLRVKEATMSRKPITNGTAEKKFRGRCASGQRSIPEKQKGLSKSVCVERAGNPGTVNQFFILLIAASARPLDWAYVGADVPAVMPLSERKVLNSAAAN